MTFSKTVKAISKKVMRNKDFANLNKRHLSYKLYQVNNQRLFRTTRGWFYQEAPGAPTIEISITSAQLFLNPYWPEVRLGW